MAKYCKNCGEILLHGVQSCKFCGTHSGENPISPETSPIFKKDYSLLFVLGIVCGLIVPLIGFAMAVYLYTRKYNENVKKYALIVLGVSLLRMIFNAFKYFA